MEILLCAPNPLVPAQKLKRHFAVRTAAHNSLKKYQEYQKKYFDKKRQHLAFAPQDRVLVFRASKKPNKKFHFKWHAGRVIRQLSASSYLVRVRHDGVMKPRKYHVSHMKRLVRRPRHLRCPPPSRQLAFPL